MSLWSALAARWTRARAPAVPPVDPITAAVDAALPVIKEFEGCRLTSYRCPAGVWTIGWGATGPDIVEGLTWTQQQADARLVADARRFAVGVARIFPGATATQAGALTSWAFNVGLGAAEQSTAARRWAAGDRAIGDELLKWTKAGGRDLPGLVRRRAAERDLFLKE